MLAQKVTGENAATCIQKKSHARHEEQVTSDTEKKSKAKSTISLKSIEWREESFEEALSERVEVQVYAMVQNTYWLFLQNEGIRYLITPP